MKSLLLSDDPSNANRRKTKIVATLGPASRSPEQIRQLIKAGVNVFRLNFSHGTHAEHLVTLQDIRDVSAKMKEQIAILQDLSGPKIRITEVDGDYVTIPGGSTVELHTSDGSLSDDKRIYVGTLDPAKVLKAGQRVLLADGIIELHAEEVFDHHVVCKASKTGRIRSRVGITFPDSDINLPATTEKDLVDMKWGVIHKVDYVAISFVQNAADIVMLRELIKEEGGQSKIVAKIERKSALQNIEDILTVTDGLMVARGDLGVELPFEQLPVIQKRLIEEANYRGIPVIVATQMLHSMITSVRPTRAEVSDIAAAVMTGTDAVMLSEETAIGEHPALAVECLGKIATEAERSFEATDYSLHSRETDFESVPDAIAYAASAAAAKIKGSVLIAPSATGATARLMAKYRPQSPLYGASSEETALRRMCLYWGVIPIPMAFTSDSTEAEIASKAVQLHEHLPNGTVAVVTGGLSGKTPGTTSTMQIRTMDCK
ncbi:pyruvate kinase [Oligoflexia bacterium]|nr:pyruvate kinase [Oligoflexia bacterium]